MSQIIKDISYIICYREANIERKQALHFVLRRVREYFPHIEILVIEQDTEPKLVLDEGLNVRYQFLYNAGPFNRSWAFNCATKDTEKNIFVFADADIFLDREGYLQCFDATEKFEAITPNMEEILNVTIDEDADHPIQVLNVRQLNSFAGGMLIMTRKAFDKIGGWDERFEGWGGEDNAMSHVIYNRLRSKRESLPNYHINHPPAILYGENQAGYERNRALAEEILTRYGAAFDRYIEQLKLSDLGNSRKYQSDISIQKPLETKKFVLAITTFNRLDFLKKCVESFFKTRSNTFAWQLIIADDNSTDGTKTYLKELEEKYDAIVIHNDRKSIHHQVNSIIMTLSDLSFDLCFRCDDDVLFLKEGWDKLYWKTIQQTGYDHLIFYDKNWQPHANLTRPIQYGNLIANTSPEKTQGAFYTLTKEIIQKVGFFDVQQFGAAGLGHVDYSFRCCRAGFNVLSSPFDVTNSNDYLRLQTVQKFSSATFLKNKRKTNSKSVLESKKRLLGMARIFIPFNESILQQHTTTMKPKEREANFAKQPPQLKYKKADSTFYPDRGIIGFFGFVLKRIYNLSIDMKLFFIPKGINALGKVINKISIHLLNIEQ